MTENQKSSPFLDKALEFKIPGKFRGHTLNYLI